MHRRDSPHAYLAQIPLDLAVATNSTLVGFGSEDLFAAVECRPHRVDGYEVQGRGHPEVVAALIGRIFDGMLVLVFLNALVRHLRARGDSYVEIPWIMGALAGALVFPTVGQLIGIPVAVLNVTSGLLLLVQPYLLLRLTSRFAPVRPLVLWGAAAWLAFSCLALVLTPGPVRGGLSLVMLAYYIVTDMYAIFLFARSSYRIGVVVRRRMIAIALATAAMMVALPIAIIPIGAHGHLSHALAAILALGASAGYVVGFTLPGWLLRRWQLPEIASFMRHAPGSGEALGHLAVTALRITGAAAVAVMEPLAADVGVDLQWYTPSKAAAPEVTHLTQPLHGILETASTEGKPGISRNLDELPDAVRTWALGSGVRQYSAIPIREQERQVGFLLILANHGFLFAQDDIDLLGHLARHTAIASENARLLAETTQEASRLSAVNRVMDALIRPLDPALLAEEMLAVLGDAMGADVSELFVLESDGLHLSRIARRPVDKEIVYWPVGHGLAGKALEQGEVIFSDDVRRDPDFVRQEEAEREGYCSLLAVPLTARGMQVGALTLIHRSHRPYAAAEIDMLRSLATPITTALQNAMLHRTAERRLKQFQLLHEISLALASELSMSQLQRRITDAARLLVASRYAALAIVDDAMKIVQFVTSGVDGTEGQVHPPMPIGEGLLGEVLHHAIPVRVTDIAAHPRSAGLPPGHPQMRSFLGVPVVYADATLGMLYVAEALESHAFSEEDQMALEALSTHAAVAIANSGLFERIEEAKSAAERANEELEQASHAKSDFLASMSHELRTPLNAILGFTEIMLDDQDLDSERRQHYLDTVHSSGRHLLGLINDILDLSKVEAGQMDLQLEVFDAALAAREVLAAVQPLATQSGIELKVESEASLQIRADRGKIKQVLYNLLANAIKFTDRGGHVQVECRRSGDDFLLAVKDTGIGIAEEDQERIFDAFQQLDASTERRYKGTGLGLALVRRFVELHGGSVALESAPGKGSRFTVYLPSPWARPESEPLAARETATASDGPLILIVEDDPRAEALLRHMLEPNGFRVEIAHNGEEALAKVKALAPAAITLDVILPGIDGWGVLQVLKGDESTRDVPVVVLTIVDDPATAYALGASDFFLKPVDRRVLVDRLSRYAGQIDPADNTRTVLVVDDDPAALALVDESLKSEGLRVLAAEDGRQALDMAEREHPDLIVLDLIMPGVSGYEVLEELRRRTSTRDIPILIVTASDLTEADKQLLTGQVLAVLRKGEYSRAELVHWLHTALR